MSEDPSERRREVAHRVAAERLAVARAPEGGAEQRAARVRLARLLVELVDRMVEADEDEEPSSVEVEEVVALLDEARDLLDELLPAAPEGSAEHRSLIATLASWTLTDAWLSEEDGDSVDTAIALYETALAPDGDPWTTSFSPDGVWDELLADDARVVLVGLMSEHSDLESDPGFFDRLILQLELLVEAPIELEEAVAATRRAYLGLALADRSRGPEFRAPANTADRGRAIGLLRTALAGHELDPLLTASAQANLGQLLLASDAAQRGDDGYGDLDPATTAEVLGLLESALETGEGSVRGYALGLVVSVVNTRCEHDPSLENRQSLVAWCRRLMSDPDAEPEDLNDGRFVLASQLFDRAEGEWPAPTSGSGVCEAYPDRAQDEAEALGLLELVLDTSAASSGPNAEDGEPSPIHLAALSGVVAILCRTSIATMESERLDRIIDRCDQLVRVIPVADEDRGGLYLQLGLALVERGKRAADPQLTALVQQMIAYHLARGERAAGIARSVPQAAADIDRSIDLLRLGSGLCDPRGLDYTRSVSVLAVGLLLKFLLQIPDGDRAVMREAIHWMRVVLEVAPESGAGLSADLRKLLVMAIVQDLWKTEPFTALHATKAGGAWHVPDLTTLPSAEDDAQVLESLIDLDLKGSAQRGERQEPVLALMSALLARMQGPHREEDYLARLERVLELDSDLEPDEFWAVMFARILLSIQGLAPGRAGAGRPEELHSRMGRWMTDLAGVADLAGRDAADQSAFNLRVDGLNRRFLEQFSEFVGQSGYEFFPGAGPDSAASDTAVSNTAVSGTVAVERYAGDPDATLRVDPDAAILIGDGSAYPFTQPVGRVLEVLDDARVAAEPVVPLIRAVALHHRWLRERDAQDFADSVAFAHRAAQDVDDRSPLSLRIAAFLSGLLLDRYSLLGDRADLDAARQRYSGLLAQAQEHAHIPDLPRLLAQRCEAAGADEISSLITRTAQPAWRHEAEGRDEKFGSFHAEILAALGATELLSATDQEGRSAAAALLGKAESLLPIGHPRRPAVLCDLGCIEAERASLSGDRLVLDAAVGKVLDAAANCAADNPHRPALLLRAAGVLGVHATATQLRSTDRAAQVLDRGIALLDEAADTNAHEYLGARSRCRYGLALLLHLRALRRGDPADLARAAEALEEARTGLNAVPGDPFAIVLRRTLAEVYRSHGAADAANRRRSREAAAAVLAGQREAVLLQTGTRRGLETARRAEQDMTRLVRWCLADGEWARAADALERGRGLVLNAATVAADVPSRLRASGQGELAERWAAADLSSSGGGEAAGLLAIPDDLRRRVLHVLEGTADERHLLAVPAPDDIAAALRQVGADAFVYLIPGTAEDPGYALIVRAKPDGAHGRAIEELELPHLRDTPDGVLAQYASALADLRRQSGTVRNGAPVMESAPERYGSRDTYITTWAESAQAAWEEALEQLCHWAGHAAMEHVLAYTSALIPGRTPRLVLAPAGMLGLVPWHAAYLDVPGRGARRLCQEAVISHCATGRQFVDAATRPRPAPDGLRAMIVDPHGSPQMHLEAGVIRSTFYPGSTVVGHLPWDADRSGPWSGPAPIEASAEVVLPLLPGQGAAAALLVANCHAAVGTTPAQSRLVVDSGHPQRTVTVEQLLAGAHRRDAHAPGGLVVLVDCDSDLALAQHDESMTLTTALLAAGAGAVIGARWLVEDSERTTVLMFMFHHFLTGRGAPEVPEAIGSPAHALRAAQCWMLDPDRRLPRSLVGRPFAREHPARPYSDTRIWAAFTHHGH